MIREISSIENRLVKMERSKDTVMNLSREIIRNAGKAITLMHARDMAGASRFLSAMKAQKAELAKAEKGFEYFSLQAHQEYAEAFLLYWILKNGRIPSSSQVGEKGQAYLLGLMDLVGELKREAFESMRKGRLKEAKHYYDLMLEIYDSTLHIRFASSILPDFRRKQDSARIQLEGTVAELVSMEGRTGRTEARP